MALLDPDHNTFSQFGGTLQASMDASTRASTDDIKKLFLDNGLTTLVLTLSCVCLSATFGVLKKIADIAFWRNKTNVAGLSVQSVPVGCILEVSPPPPPPPCGALWGSSHPGPLS